MSDDVEPKAPSGQNGLAKMLTAARDSDRSYDLARILALEVENERLRGQVCGLIVRIKQQDKAIFELGKDRDRWCRLAEERLNVLVMLVNAAAELGGSDDDLHD